MKDTQNFTAQRLPNGVTEITDLSGVHCFLVEGRDKALLIDTMTGLRGLPAFVATLTDLPVEVALTHGHMDHAGGVFEFGRCYIHPADIPMLDGPVEFVPLKAGDKLDLGGRALEVLHVPGHTRGSLCYLDTASGDFFAGDACNNNTLLMMDVSATIEEYLGALLALKERQGDIRRFYLFHGPSLQDKSCIDDNIQCCRDILAGTDDRVPVDFLGRPGYLAKERTPGTFSRKDGRFGNIVYNPQQVRKG